MRSSDRGQTVHFLPPGNISRGVGEIAECEDRVQLMAEPLLYI